MILPQGFSDEPVVMLAILSGFSGCCFSLYFSSLFAMLVDLESSLHGLVIRHCDEPLGFSFSFNLVWFFFVKDESVFSPLVLKLL